MIRSGEIQAVRRGGYLRGEEELGLNDRHRALIRTTVPLLGADTVLSHASAAVVWELPAPSRLLDKVHVIRPSGNGQISSWMHNYRLPLAPEDIDHGHDVPITTLARTVADLCRICSHPEALAIMDAAWRRTGGLEEVSTHVGQASRRHGVSIAKWALAHADRRAESPGESISRYWMIRSGIPMPELQFEVRDYSGALVGRADFGWEQQRLIGEFDGRIKYDQLVPAGRTAADVVMAEKERENRFRRLGYWVHRWGWRQLRDGQVFMKYLHETIGV